VFCLWLYRCCCWSAAAGASLPSCCCCLMCESSCPHMLRFSNPGRRLGSRSWLHSNSSSSGNSTATAVAAVAKSLSKACVSGSGWILRPAWQSCAVLCLSGSLCCCIDALTGLGLPPYAIWRGTTTVGYNPAQIRPTTPTTCAEAEVDRCRIVRYSLDTPSEPVRGTHQELGTPVTSLRRPHAIQGGWSGKSTAVDQISNLVIRTCIWPSAAQPICEIAVGGLDCTRKPGEAFCHTLHSFGCIQISYLSFVVSYSHGQSSTCSLSCNSLQSSQGLTDHSQRLLQHVDHLIAVPGCVSIALHASRPLSMPCCRPTTPLNGTPPQT
jgi:hypothetical protein